MILGLKSRTFAAVEQVLGFAGPAADRSIRVEIGMAENEDGPLEKRAVPIAGEQVVQEGRRLCATKGTVHFVSLPSVECS
jgi:hypothetical protein